MNRSSRFRRFERAILLLVSSSIKHQSRRSLLQAALVAVVVVLGGACLVVGRGGGTSIVDMVESSGAAIYRIDARVSGKAVPVDTALIPILSEVNGVDYVSGQADFLASLTSDAGLDNETGLVVAVSPSYLDLKQVSVWAGVPALAKNSGGYGVLIGRTAAANFGISEDCVVNQACSIYIDGTEFVVSAIIIGDQVSEGVFIDLETAVRLDLVAGPDELLVSSKALPAFSTRRSLDLIASNWTNQTISVREPTAAAALREGVSATWKRSIAAMAVLLLLMGAAGQVAIQRSVVRSRHREIATLRSIGYPPFFIITQFLVEPLILAVGGAIAGFVILAGAAAVSLRLFDYQLDLPTLTALLIAGNALVVSVGASILAANLAARVSPSEALQQ